MLPRLMRLNLLLATCLLPVLSAACSAGKTASDSATSSDSSSAHDTAHGPGTLALAFQMEADLIPSMTAPPVGTFGGSIYAEADATALGPNDGAVSLEDISVALDLTNNGGPTGVVYTTQPLAGGVVWILGCLDLNGDGCANPGEPITIPNEDKVIVVAGAETPFTVVMNMLDPSS